MNIDVLYETVIDDLLNATVEIHDHARYVHMGNYGNPNGLHRWDIYIYFNRYSIYDFNNYPITFFKYIE